MSELETVEGVKQPLQVKEVVKPINILYLYKPLRQNQFLSPCPLFLVFVAAEDKTREVVLKQGVHVMNRLHWDALEQKEYFRRLIESGEVTKVADSEQLLEKYAVKPGKQVVVKREVVDFIQATYKITLLESWVRWIIAQNSDKFVIPMTAIRKQIKELKAGKIELPSFSDDWNLQDIDADEYGDLED